VRRHDAGALHFSFWRQIYTLKPSNITFFTKKDVILKNSITFVTENYNKELANKYINNEKEPVMDAGCHPDLRPGNNLVYLY